MIRKLWGRSLASAQEQAQLIGRTSRAAIYATTPMYQPFDDLLKIIKIVASSVVELDVSPAITQSTSVFITRALQQMQEGTTATVRSGQPRIIGSIRVTPDLCLLLMTLFESVGDYKSAKLLFQLSKTNKKFHNYSSLPGLLRMALKNRDYNFIFEMVEGSLNTSKTQLPSDNKEHILLKSSDPIENTENKSKQIYVASKSKPISYQLRSALFSPVLLSLAELNRPDLMYDILTVEMPRTNTKPSPSQVKIGMEALLATGHYEKGAELFFHFFEPEDSSSSSSSSIGTEISSKLLVTPSAVLVALECCASGGLGAQALRVLSTVSLFFPLLLLCSSRCYVYILKHVHAYITFCLYMLTYLQLFSFYFS